MKGFGLESRPSAHRDSPRLPPPRGRSASGRVLAGPLGGLVLLLLATPVLAQEWQVRPNANLELGYDDNVRTTTEAGQGSFVSRARAGLRAIRATENTNLGLAAGLGLNGFADAADLDNTSGFLGLDSAYRGERNQLRLNASFDTQSTLTSEVATTGLTQINAQRYQIGVRPSWTHLVSERASVSLGLSYTNAFYDDVGEVPLYDYWQGGMTLGGTYRLSERGGLNLNLDYSRYEAQGPTNETDNMGAQVGVDYLISETLSLAFLVGLRRTDATYAAPGAVTVTDESTGPSYRIRLSQRLASGGGFNVEAAREMVPSGSSELLDTTSLLLG